MTRTELASQKDLLRKRILQLRNRQSPSQIERNSLKIIQRVLELPEYKTAHIIATYVGKGSEVQTQPLIKNALASRKEILVPVVATDTGTLVFSRIINLHELTPGTFGIPEPRPDFTRPQQLETADLILVPGIAWDPDGYRLGWGRGYFDEALKQLSARALAIGLGYELQIVPHIPREQFDLPVNMLVSEERVVRCHG